MRQQPLILGVLCVVAALAVWFLCRPAAERSAGIEGGQNRSIQTVPPGAGSSAKSTPDLATNGAVPPKPGAAPTGTSAQTLPPTNVAIPMHEAVVDEAALKDIDHIHLMLRDYRTIAGENPVGTNAEIMKSVIGGNPKQATLGPPEGQSLNQDGELLDRWGTPYFFHQISAKEMQVRSAGPDRKMWTDDDVQQ